ncbi:metabolite traffic protein EboE [Robertkochia solimangrovi]|uniref:metabolite traffic protein EboE n=1 Tax=Robertkochia solimangrovi TaxID=2213046 RepID=UPI00117F3C33|nr:metabolite traffic protein EboE [Robertkochia solimangrovi]TRZ42890.1 xylose isomerase [Robertkochia solimangrovi]
MLINDKYHLSYCTNIHPGENWAQTFANLRIYLPEVKKKMSPETPFGIGLRLSNKASEELHTGTNLYRFKQWLEANDMYVFTMNGFPYGNFHFSEVKDLVHAPDWTKEDRLEYTLRLFDQLNYLLPKGVSGGISTSPVSYKHWHTTEELREKSFEKAAFNMARVVHRLYDLECVTGKYMHLDIEPEPDGLIENSFELINYYRAYLIPAAAEYLRKELDKNPVEAEEMVLRYIQVCYDTCHFALAYENPDRTFKRFAQTGIRIGKIQISSALKVQFSGDNDRQLMEELSKFIEPVYLHQVTEKTDNGVRTYSDLPAVVNSKRKFKELRAHFHVPIFLEKYGNLMSTQEQILQTIKYLAAHPGLCEHIEVETYTWEVLPQDLKLELTESIHRELTWLKTNLLNVYEEDCSS